MIEGKQCEDSFVEFKSTWLDDHRKAARRMAALCNAARGAEVLWVVGVDEKGMSVPGVDANEMSDWWPRVEKCFDDGVAPDITTLVFDWSSNATVSVIYMRTDNAPYILKTGQEPYSIEVPWRSAEKTRSAKRSELLQLLVPQARAPKWAPIEGEARLLFKPEHEAWNAQGQVTMPDRYELNLDASIFFEAFEPFFIPDMRVSSSIVWGDGSDHMLEVDVILTTTRAHRSELGIVVQGDGAIRVNQAAALSSYARLKSVDPELARRLESAAKFEWRISVGLNIDGPAMVIPLVYEKEVMEEIHSRGQMVARWAIRPPY
ncbi:hypothetical protein [Saccharothrix australiensis]|nr:hypothetical protein [Saccharothrix australiensis]